MVRGRALDPGMRRPPVALFCVPIESHFRLLRPLMADLAAAFDLHVFTHSGYSARVEAAGGRFVDLFDGCTVEDVDDESMPMPCRFVTFAVHRAEHVLDELRSIRPVLVVYETFSVIAPVVARQLGVPYVNVSPGHNLDPAALLPHLRAGQHVAVSSACHAAVDVLRERYGMTDASPFSYVTTLSPWLNVCCEPSAFLPESARASLEPLAFYGLLPAEADCSRDHWRIAGRPPSAKADGDGIRQIYVSFGSIVWRYYAAEALAALRAIVEAARLVPEVSVLIGLGGADVPSDALPAAGNVRVELWSDQWGALQATDVFITHHGINSTHEAIFHGVPMLSYPFFFDQPALAERCRELGLAIPLTSTPRGPLQAEDVLSAIDELRGRAEEMRASLDVARKWEQETIAGRQDVLQRIAQLLAVA